MSSVELVAAETPLVLALDIGTSSIRALVFDGTGRAITGLEEQKRYDLRTTHDGGAEADAESLFEILVGCIDGVLAKLGEQQQSIEAVGASCFWHSLLGLDRIGRPITPVLYWGDTRSTQQVDDLRRTVDVATFHSRTGCPVHSSYWPSKLRWLRQVDSETFNRVAHWCSFGEYAMRRLHGASAGAASISMASGTGLLDVRMLDWDDEVIAISGVRRELLPSLIDFDTRAMSLAPDFAARWPQLKRVPWFPTLGDGACANVGGGAVEPHRLALTVGTSGATRLITEQVDREVPERLWMYRLDRKRAVIGGSLSNGGNVLSWLRRLCNATISSPDWRAASALDPDAHGLTLLPFLAGERAPSWNPHVNGVIAGLTLATSSADLLRAGMESVAYRFAIIYESLAPLAATPHEIVAGGGAILNSAGWLQIVADVLDHDILAPSADEEASARGAAIMTLVALGALSDIAAAPDPALDSTVYSPDSVRHKRYAVALDRHRCLEALLFPAGRSWDSPPTNQSQ